MSVQITGTTNTNNDISVENNIAQLPYSITESTPVIIIGGGGGGGTTDLTFVSSNIVPDNDNNRNLGTNSIKWANAFVYNMYVNSIDISTNIGGAAFINFKNKIDASLNNVYTKLYIDTSFGQVYTKFTQVDSSFTQVDISLVDVNSRLELLDTSFTNVSNKYGILGEKIDFSYVSNKIIFYIK